MKKGLEIYKSHNISSISKFVNQNELILNVFDPGMISITICIGETMGKIVQFSSNLPGALGYDSSEM